MPHTFFFNYGQKVMNGNLWQNLVPCIFQNDRAKKLPSREEQYNYKFIKYFLRVKREGFDRLIWQKPFHVHMDCTITCANKAQLQ